MAKSSIESPRVTRGSPRLEESQAEALSVQNTTFQEFASFSFSKSHQQARESCTEIFGS